MAKGLKTGGRKAGVPNKATRELREIAQPYAPKAIAMLCRIMQRSENDMARVSAARELLDRGYGRPVNSGTQIDASNTSNTQVNIVCDEATRKALIAAREKLLSGQPIASPQSTEPKLVAGI
jgi:hypothetical protein